MLSGYGSCSVGSLHGRGTARGSSAGRGRAGGSWRSSGILMRLSQPPSKWNLGGEILAGASQLRADRAACIAVGDRQQVPSRRVNRVNCQPAPDERRGPDRGGAGRGDQANQQQRRKQPALDVECGTQVERRVGQARGARPSPSGESPSRGLRLDCWLQETRRALQQGRGAPSRKCYRPRGSRSNRRQSGDGRLIRTDYERSLMGPATRCWRADSIRPGETSPAS